jgi:hypothetical protein
MTNCVCVCVCEWMNLNKHPDGRMNATRRVTTQSKCTMKHNKTKQRKYLWNMCSVASYVSFENYSLCARWNSSKEKQTNTSVKRCIVRGKYVDLPSNVTRPSLSESMAANALAMADSSEFVFEWKAWNSFNVMKPSLS